MPSIETLTITESHALLSELLVHQGTTKQFRRGIRNYTIGVLLLETGVRVGELVRLLVGDLWYVDQPVSMITVSTEKQKSDESRQIPVSTLLSKALIEMHEKVWSFDIATSGCYAFYYRDPSTPLTVRQVERIIKAAAKEARCSKCHPHMLRHTFATKVLAKTNTRVTQILLGHKHLTSTQVYTHPNSDDLRKAVD